MEGSRALDPPTGARVMSLTHGLSKVDWLLLMLFAVEDFKGIEI